MSAGNVGGVPTKTTLPFSVPNPPATTAGVLDFSAAACVPEAAAPPDFSCFTTTVVRLEAPESTPSLPPQPTMYVTKLALAASAAAKPIRREIIDLSSL